MVSERGVEDVVVNRQKFEKKVCESLVKLHRIFWRSRLMTSDSQRLAGPTKADRTGTEPEWHMHPSRQG